MGHQAFFQDLATYVKEVTIPEHTWVVIDEDTGTVLGTNLKLCLIPNYFMDEVLKSDEEGRQAAREGEQLYAHWTSGSPSPASRVSPPVHDDDTESSAP